MKNLFFSLIVFSFVLPFFVGAESEQEALENYILNIANNPSATTSTTISPDLLQNFFPQQTTGYQYNPNLSEEDNFILQPREGETAADYINRINIENARRKAFGESLLPDPTISTTQIPENNGVIRPPLNGPAPRIDQPITPTQTQPSNITRGSKGTLLDSIIPLSTFDGQGDGLSGVLNQLFYAGLIIAVVLAIVMIIRGGVEYMTIDAASNKESAKNRIKAAIGGLILCFSTILILNTINPGLTKLELKFPELENLRPVSLSGTVKLRGRDLTITQVNADGTVVAVDPNGEEYILDTSTTGDAGAVVKGDFSNITVADLRPHLGSNYSNETLQAFIDAGKQYGIDPRFLASISKFETANGTSKAFTDGRNNAMGTSNDTGPIGFSSVRDSIFAQTRSLTRSGGYYSGANTIQQIGDIYSPSKDPKTGQPYKNDINGTNWSWAGNVSSNYSKMTGGSSDRTITNIQ